MMWKNNVLQRRRNSQKGIGGKVFKAISVTNRAAFLKKALQVVHRLQVNELVVDSFLTREI